MSTHIKRVDSDKRFSSMSQATCYAIQEMDRKEPSLEAYTKRYDRAQSLTVSGLGERGENKGEET